MEQQASNTSPASSWRNVRCSIAVLSLMLAGLLVVLWNRSYAYSDSLDGPLPRSYVFEFSTRYGRLSGLVSGPAFKRDRWNYSSESLPRSELPPVGIPISNTFAFQGGSISGLYLFVVPTWFPLLLVVTVAAAIGIRPPYRFGLRALLLATTYVAVVLGLAVVFRR